MTKKSTLSRHKIAIQSLLCPAQTPVAANVDFHRFKQTLDDIDAALRQGPLEAQAMDMALEDCPAHVTPSQLQRRARFALESLRQEILRHLLGMPSIRSFSKMLCGSDLLADFCGLREIDGISGAAKSTLERRSKLFSEEQLRRLLATLTEVCGNADLAPMVGLDAPIAMDTCLVDGTCLEANIHFPVDWVLLGDVAETLLKAVKLIRAEGVLCRMPESPEELLRAMNNLAIEMTHARRRNDANKRRKKLLRKMKKHLRCIGAHARSHMEKLRGNRQRTRFSQREAERIIERMNAKLDQIDPVIKQAHERIIGGRAVASKDKILSVHEKDAHVIVRGKAGREVEFGNTLFISETLEGYISDWKLYTGRAPGEPEQLAESLRRQNAYDLEEPVKEVCADRGFTSKGTTKGLNDLGIYDATCPRDVQVLRERMGEERFRELQKRRGGTEARIATLKNRWLGGRVRAKGAGNRSLAVGWAVLAHNLWLVARLLAQSREEARAA